MNAYLRPIDALIPRASRSFGGKARNLAALVRAGFPVPAAYALPSEAAQRTYARALPPALQPAQIWSRTPVSESELKEARQRVLSADFDAEVSAALSRAFKALHGAAAESVAVRSSSPAEDAGLATAAGLHTTLLNVRSGAALADAVRQCFAGVFSTRAIGYAQSLGPDALNGIGVVIQAMVPASASGQLYTANPLTGDPAEMVIDAGYGVAVGLQDAGAALDTYRVEKERGWVRDRVASQARKQVLDEHMLAQLIALGRRIEEHFGEARAVDFAVAGDNIYVLQARPLSAIVTKKARARTRRNTRLTDSSAIAWSRLPMGEGRDAVSTPLIWSVLSGFSDQGVRRVLLALGYKMRQDAAVIGNFRGRVYLNVSELSHIGMRVPGFRASLVLPSAGRPEAERIEQQLTRARTAGLLLGLPRAVTKLVRASLGFGRRVTRFQIAFDAERVRVESIDLRILAPSALGDTLSDCDHLLHEAGAMLLAAYADLSAMLVLLRGALVVLRSDDNGRIPEVLLAALGDIERAGAVVPDTDAVVSRLPIALRPALRGLLSAVQSSFAHRERLRLDMAHALELIRLVAHDASRRLCVREPFALENAAFYLTLDELHGLLGGELGSVATLVAMRRKQHLREQSLPEPPHTFVGYPAAPSVLGDG